MDIISRAHKVREYIETQSANLTDEEALELPDVFPEWEEGEYYAVGDRVTYDSKVYKCLSVHEALSSWRPDEAFSLWAEVLASSGEPAEWRQPDSTNAYMSGDRVTFEGAVYESVIDNNVWSPSAYPAGWVRVS